MNIQSAGGKRFLTAVAFIGLICASGFAQDTTASASTPPDAPSATAQGKQENEGFVQLLARSSFAFPDIATSDGRFGPKQKFQLAVRDSVSIVTILAAAGSAGFNQAIDSPEGYGQGGEGYAKRFGSGMARASSTNILGTFILASAFHEDPRFYVKKDLSFAGAVKYSIARTFVTRSDSGKDTVSIYGLVGPLGAEFLANTYYPPGDRSAGDALTRYATDLGAIAAGHLLKQYWPTINKRLLKPKD